MNDSVDLFQPRVTQINQPKQDLSDVGVETELLYIKHETSGCVPLLGGLNDTERTKRIS